MYLQNLWKSCTVTGVTVRSLQEHRRPEQPRLVDVTGITPPLSDFYLQVEKLNYHTSLSEIMRPSQSFRSQKSC